MEELWPTLPSLTPGLGAAALLGWLLVRFWREARQERAAYQQAIAELRAEHATLMREQAARHDAQIAELRQQQATQISDLRGEVTVLRSELTQLRGEVEEQRRARWRAEDAAAHYRRQLGMPPDAEVPADGR